MSSDKSTIQPRLLKGFRDTLPANALIRNHIMRNISRIVGQFGFLPLETPALEYADILEGKLGDEGEKLLYKFSDHGGRSVAMRYDFTVPLARFVAQNPDLPKPFKRYQVGPVWRADNTQRGRYREFYQYDLDIVGTDSPMADAEVLVLAQEIMKALNIKEFTLRINHRGLLHDLIEDLSLSPEQHQQFLIILDKRDKIGHQAVLEEWKGIGLNESQLSTVESFLNSPPTDSASAVTLQEIIAHASALGLEPSHFTLDPTIVRGLDYYTGLVVETILPQAPEFGSVLSGGRYDGLIGRFSKQEIPAVGVSVGLDRLMAALEHLQVLPQIKTSTQGFMTVFDEKLALRSQEVAQALRQQGVNIELSYTMGNIGKQIKLAAAKHIPFALIIGPDEAAIHQVTLRNLANGQERTLTVDEAAVALQRTQS